LRDLRRVVKGEVAEGIPGREERLQRLAAARQVVVPDLGPGVEVGQPIALVEVAVLLGDDVEVGVEGGPGPLLFVLAEAGGPALHGQIVRLRDIEPGRGAPGAARVAGDP
jgi:hypothetical protein